MKNLFDQIKLLYDYELYSNVARLCSLAVTICDQKPEIASPHIKFKMYVQYADSLYQLEQYSKAEQIYFQALQLRKSVIKNKSATKPQENTKDFASDVEIKYKIHMCYIKLKQLQKAVNILQLIPVRSRTAKVNMALGNLYKESGMERSAITSYKEVLREVPLALEAAESLLSLGIKGIEVNSLMLEGTSDHLTTSWINSWMQAQAEINNRDYRLAINTLSSMDAPGLLRDNVPLLVTLGQCHHYSGFSNKALTVLQRVRSLDPLNHIGLDILASILAEKDLEELDKIVPSDIDFSQYTPEHWIVMAYCMYATKKFAKAACFAQKACILSPRNVEALILKGIILYELKNYQDAVVHLREAMQIAPYRYEPYENLVLCYATMNRVREALTIASNARKQLGQTPRALTIYASVLIRDPVTISKGKALLERAVRSDQDGAGVYLPAVYLLVEVYEQEMSLNQAAQLLAKHAELTPTSKLHMKLGDIMARLYMDDKAFYHYNIALNLDPSNHRAMEGMLGIGRSNSSGKLDSSMYMSVGGGESSSFNNQGGTNNALSDHEQEQESDTEPWPHIDMLNQSFP